MVWPVITSCYNLEDDGSRIGHLDLFLVGVLENDSDPLAFGEPHLSFGCRSGILDGNWLLRMRVTTRDGGLQQPNHLVTSAFTPYKRQRRIFPRAHKEESTWWVKFLSPETRLDMDAFCIIIYIL